MSVFRSNCHSHEIHLVAFSSFRHLRVVSSYNSFLYSVVARMRDTCYQWSDCGLFYDCMRAGCDMYVTQFHKQGLLNFYFTFRSFWQLGVAAGLGFLIACPIILYLIYKILKRRNPNLNFLRCCCSKIRSSSTSLSPATPSIFPRHHHHRIVQHRVHHPFHHIRTHHNRHR